MEIAGEDGFRIRSYRNGAAAIEGHPERISGISDLMPLEEFRARIAASISRGQEKIR